MPAAIAFVIISLMIGCGEGKNRKGTIDLSGAWEVSGRDDAHFAPANTPGRSIASVMLPGQWSGMIAARPDYSAVFRIRKKIIIGKEFYGKAFILSLGQIAIADETYFNGEFIGGEGSIPSADTPLKYRFAWKKERNYFVPSGLVRYGAENIVSVRVFSHIMGGLAGKPRLTVYPDKRRLTAASESIGPLIKGGILVVNIVSLLFFLLLVKSNTQRKEIYFTIILLFTACLLILLVFDILPVEQGLVRFKILFMLIPLEFMFGFMIMNEFFGVKSGTAAAIAAALQILDIIGIASAPSSAALVKISGIFSLPLMAAYLTGANIFAVIGLRRDFLRYRKFIPFAVIINAIVINSLHRMLYFRLYKVSTLALLAVPILALIVIVYKMADLISARNERDSFARSLLKKTQQLNRAMRLMKKDARPEPREVISGVIEHLDKNYFESYDRKSLAKKFNLNEDYMGQVFKKVTGRNISNYLNMRRIEAARQLLLETDSKVIDIAYHVGFENLTHFHRLFKQQTGCTPNDYRKSTGPEKPCEELF